MSENNYQPKTITYVAAGDLTEGQHFWMRGELHLVHEIAPAWGEFVKIEVGRGSIITRADEKVILKVWES